MKHMKTCSDLKSLKDDYNDLTKEFTQSKISVKTLKKEGYYIVGVEQVENATLLQNFNHAKPIAIIFGHEVHGIDQKIINMCDEVIEIPQFGTKHSLNISVSAGLVIWTLFKNFIDKKNKI